jgi:hypothetical protein
MDNRTRAVAFLRGDSYMPHEIQITGGYIVTVDIRKNAGSGNL